MSIKILNKKGFTLMEIIATLVLVGIIVALAGAGMARIVDGFFFTKKNAETVQKGQAASARLFNEFKNISSVAFGSASSITFYKNGVAGAQTVSRSGSDLLLKLNDDTLTDNTTAFNLRYFDNYSSAEQTNWSPTRRIIEFTIRMKGANDIETNFAARVAPRNL